MTITDDYYHQHAQSFFDTTVNIDVQKLYDRFLPLIKPHGRMLDAGCGSGRDSHHFMQLGFDVVAFDANQSLVELASKYLGVSVTHATFDSFAATDESFDGIWACASLLHVPSEELPSIMCKLGELLAPQGLFYCSFKYGSSEQVRNGRHFTDLDEAGLENVLASSNLEIQQTWISGDARPERASEKWLNAILVKRPQTKTLTLNK